MSGQPTAANNGTARTTFRYDNRGNIVENAFFDLDGKPTEVLRHADVNETQLAAATGMAA